MKYTREDIIREIKKNQSLDNGYGSGWAYYLHHDGEKFVPCAGDGIKTFCWPAQYIDDLSAECDASHPDDEQAAQDEFWGSVYDLETEDNADFVEVADGLRDEVNEWIEEGAEC